MHFICLLFQSTPQVGLPAAPGLSPGSQKLSSKSSAEFVSAPFHPNHLVFRFLSNSKKKFTKVHSLFLGDPIEIFLIMLEHFPNLEFFAIHIIAPQRTQKKDEIDVIPD
jgi:hypothetical protein